MNRLRRIRVLAAFLLLAAGGTFCAEGAWTRAKASFGQILLERAWRASASEQEPIEPWPGAGTRPIARLEAPDHGTSLLVLSEDTRKSLALGPAHVSGSALPGGVGNTVIAGHRDTHFRFVRHLRLGDRLRLATPDGDERSYRIERTEIFDETSPLVAPTRRPTLTLVTCYPFDFIGPAPRRYAVHARAIERD